MGKVLVRCEEFKLYVVLRQLDGGLMGGACRPVPYGPRLTIGKDWLTVHDGLGWPTTAHVWIDRMTATRIGRSDDDCEP